MTETPDLSNVMFHLRTDVYHFHQRQEGPNDCGPTSLSIAANALLKEQRFYGRQVAEEMNNPAFEVRPFPHFVVRRIRNWATFPWGIVHYLQQQDIPARWSLMGSVDRLRRNLLADRITIVIHGEPLRRQGWRLKGWSHAKVLFGYTPEQSFLFVDPAKDRGDDPDCWEHFGLSEQLEKPFLRQWRNVLRIYIEVG